MAVRAVATYLAQLFQSASEILRSTRAHRWQQPWEAEFLLNAIMYEPPPDEVMLRLFRKAYKFAGVFSFFVCMVFYKVAMVFLRFSMDFPLVWWIMIGKGCNVLCWLHRVLRFLSGCIDRSLCVFFCLVCFWFWRFFALCGVLHCELDLFFSPCRTADCSTVVLAARVIKKAQVELRAQRSEKGGHHYRSWKTWKQLKAQRSEEREHGKRKRTDMLKIESRPLTVNCLGKRCNFFVFWAKLRNVTRVLVFCGLCLFVAFCFLGWLRMVYVFVLGRKSPTGAKWTNGRRGKQSRITKHTCRRRYWFKLLFGHLDFRREL